uniref:Fungal lipase-like domain-containing protein n=1 Tax=Plectus sambesii TaxID=2011161 RepID=A0A914W4I4_9BILA
MIIAFRGTTTKLQLFVQTAYTLGPKEEFYAMGKVQRYFKDALEAIWSNVQPFLELADYKSYSISFTGHSLGGALASLAAVRTVKDGYRTSNQIKLITFGQPRVGDSTFAAMHDQLIPYSFRVVNKADLVPHLPPCKTTNDMCDPDPERKSAYHHGTEIWYSNGMGVNATYRVCAGLPFDEDNTCSNSLPDLSFKVDDHTHYFDQMVSQFGKSGCIDDD